MKSNRAVGNAVEQEFCDILFGYGWWSHNLNLNTDGLMNKYNTPEAVTSQTTVL